jgi:hypothetical protein
VSDWDLGIPEEEKEDEEDFHFGSGLGGALGTGALYLRLVLRLRRKGWTYHKFDCRAQNMVNF